MFVLKRNGEQQEVHFDKITSRMKKLAYGLDPRFFDPTLVAQKVIQGVCPGVTTVQLDLLAAETAAYMSTIHPDYGILAARISISNLHKSTTKPFSQTIHRLRHLVHPSTGEPAPLISEWVYDIVMENAARLDAVIVHDRDFNYDYFGFKTLERAYLLKIDGKPAERPQHMLLRVAIGIHLEDVDAAIETYHLMSRKVFTHATPTLFNSGTPRPQMSSCFLLTMKDDSIQGIYDTLCSCAVISKYAGGIGLAVHNVRAKGSYVAGTNGHSNGLVPMLRVFDATARYVDQGGGKRKGSFAVYLEPWHADIEEFLELKKNNGKDQDRARDLFYALWIPDLFMRRVEANGDWSLFCPNEAKGMSDVYGEEFDALYAKHEATPGLARKTMRAQELWNQILCSQIETGTPYMLYKDACNRKSNQKNLGTIKSSNLCTEIIQYTAPDEIAVCNLASINLRAFVNKVGEDGEWGEGGSYNFAELARVTKVVVCNLNKVIDNNYYPVPEAKTSNLKHRPIGVGVQGLADAFVELRMPFESPQAKQLNRDIFETIYFAACTASMELAKVHGPYESFQGSPMSQGIFQFDMWDQQPNPELGWDWDQLRRDVMQYGVRNSLLIAPMPTASTSQILGNNEAFEPFTSNLYSRRVLAGDFVVINQHLVKDLIKLGLWTPELKQQIVAARGSVQHVAIPDDLKELYKTVWEIKQRCILDMAADRGAFIDQSQSLNIHMVDATVGKLTSMHFHGWKIGLKTGLYYLRTKPKADAIQFTLDPPQVRAALHAIEGKSQFYARSQSIARNQFFAKAALVEGEDGEEYTPASPKGDSTESSSSESSSPTESSGKHVGSFTPGTRDDPRVGEGGEADSLPEDVAKISKPIRKYLNSRHAWNALYNKKGGSYITSKHPDYDSHDDFLLSWATPEDLATPVVSDRKYLVGKSQPKYKAAAELFDEHNKIWFAECEVWAGKMGAVVEVEEEVEGCASCGS